jgi:iron complex outermembrane receptor protein
MMTYLSASSGFKAGGYNGVGFTPDPFEQETVENYELGYKSTWLDSRLRFNVAAFYYEYNDLQILEFVKLPGTSFSQHYLGNGDARARGLETEVQWMVQDSLMLTFNSAYLDTEYVKYVKATSTGYRNLADEPMSTVPKETYNLGAEYTMTAGDLGDFIFRFDTSYIGDRVDNTGEQDKTIGSYTVTNARITYAHVSGDWEAALWADNLFDKDYLLGGTQSLAAGEANSPMVRRGTPRFWGVDYRHYF